MMAQATHPLSLRVASGVGNNPSRKAVKSFKFLKKLGIKKPGFLPDFGKPEGLGNSKVSVEKSVPGVTADKMWAVVSDWPAPYIKGDVQVTSTSGSGVGATRVLFNSPAKAEFIEELISIDNDKKKFAYKISSESPFPFENYGAKFMVDSEDEGCSVSLTAWYDPTPDCPEDFPETLTKLLESFVDNAIAIASK